MSMPLMRQPSSTLFPYTTLFRSFRLPCLTNRAVTFRGGKKDGESMPWNEWEFTFLHFPGQTLYHGGLVAKRDDGQTYLRSEEHTSELQSRLQLVCRLQLDKKN